jgi:hypothetical protein
VTDASIKALSGLRDLSTLQWYAVPLLAIVFYIYTMEIKKAREGGDWNPLAAAIAIFGADFLNESWNGWVLVLSGRSALWTAPGPTALRTTVGWNIEIMFMFALLGFIFYHSLSRKPGARILGLPEAWAIGLGYSIVCVAIECCLNAARLLAWEYPFWSRSLGGVWSVLIVGYFWFFAWAILAISRKAPKAKFLVASAPWAAAIILNVVAACLGWRY